MGQKRFRIKGKGKYWYRVYHYRCPECGTEEIIKKREYLLPKPERDQDRHVYIEDYDYCKEPSKDDFFEKVNIFDSNNINEELENSDIELDDVWAPKDWS